MISNISTNLDKYPNRNVPRFEKLEVTFLVDTDSSNPQFPYDPTPPQGLVPGIGINVDALFSPDNWQTTYSQPAFYFQEFQDDSKGGRAWFYPTGVFYWKVRFAPNIVGTWQYKLVAQDDSGKSETPPQSFNVAPSTSHGFIRTSQTDPRYFEFDDGTYFPGLGYNMNFDQIRWDEPIGDFSDVNSNAYNFQQMGKNGIQLIRMWLSQWSIFGSSAGQWRSASQDSEFDGLSVQAAAPGHEVSMLLTWDYNPAMFLGWMKATPAVKPNTKYHVSFHYMIPQDLIGPRISASPTYGLVAKLGGWINDPWEANTGKTVTPYRSNSPKNASGQAQWSVLEGEFTTTASQYFLDDFYLVLENINATSPSSSGGLSNAALIDDIEIREELGSGKYGANIISKPIMDQHTYFDQRYSYSFDKVLELAHQNGIYLRPVILERNDWIFDRIQLNGTMDQNKSSSDNFYGNWRTMTKMRWLQQAWWRYLQARWGYSPNIHSWELLNEGDPYSGLHYTLADEFGKYMHCTVFSIWVGNGNQEKCTYDHPNAHLVSTSFWHSFPTTPFWTNPDYPNINFADIHQYIFKNESLDLRVDKPAIGNSIHVADLSDFFDSAAETQKLSKLIGAKQAYGVGKPTIRGETGFVEGNSDGWVCDLLADTTGIWLHNFIWGGINSGGMLDSGNWYTNIHIYADNLSAQKCLNTGPYKFDHRSEFGNYYRFIKDVQLNNGRYEDAAANVSDLGLRVWGQKDIHGGKAHLWIANQNHTWKNIIDGNTISPISGTITIEGFQPDQKFTIIWWDTYQIDPLQQIIRKDVIYSKENGSITFTVDRLISDTAVQIFPYQPTETSNLIFIPDIFKN